MKIVVAMKQTPDLQQIRIKDRKPVFDDVPMTFSKIDKNALEAGVQMKEADQGEVVIVSVGSEALEDTIKEALAADADRAVLLADDQAQDMDSAQVAEALSQLVKTIGEYDLILFGEGSGDNYSGLMASRVAEMLNLPQIGFASEIQVSGNTIRVKRSLEDSDEVLEVDLPAVVSVLADLNEPRIPAVSKILKAGRKPKEILSIDDVDLAVKEAQVLTISNLVPVMSRKGIEVKNKMELIDALKSEGYVGR